MGEWNIHLEKKQGPLTFYGTECQKITTNGRRDEENPWKVIAFVEAQRKDTSVETSAFTGGLVPRTNLSQSKHLVLSLGLQSRKTARFETPLKPRFGAQL